LNRSTNRGGRAGAGDATVQSGRGGTNTHTRGPICTPGTRILTIATLAWLTSITLLSRLHTGT